MKDPIIGGKVPSKSYFIHEIEQHRCHNVIDFSCEISGSQFGRWHKTVGSRVVASAGTNLLN